MSTSQEPEPEPMPEVKPPSPQSTNGKGAHDTPDDQQSDNGA